MSNKTEILSNKAAKRQQRSLRGDSTSSYYSILQTRLISDLIHTLSDRLPKKPCTSVKSAIAELVTFLEGSIGQTTSSSSSECYDSFLSTQLSTLRTIDGTFDVLADMILGEGLAAESSVDDLNRLVDIAANSHSSHSSMGDTSQLVDTMLFYSHLLVDFTTWLSTLHQGFNDLPIPLAAMEGILEVSSQTEHEVLQYLNTNCRSK